MTALTFTLPDGRAADGPPERRGLQRDQVRLMVVRPDRIADSRFDMLGDHLEPGDLVVVNTSATLPAAVDAEWRGQAVVAHFSTRLDTTTWVIELRRTDGSGPILDAAPGDTVEFGGPGSGTLEGAMGEARGGYGVRLWRTRLYLPETVEDYLAKYGRPIRYDYLRGSWPLEVYQTVFSRMDDPSGASAEMPSAGRPFTTELVTDLISSGIGMAHIVLHTGVSSLERDEPPQPEPYVVPASTAEMVMATKRRGNRVVAVGTTVTRALETVAILDGAVAPGSGWTDLILDLERPSRVVDGLITGWHPPQASQLLLLEAVAGPELVSRAYRRALESEYLWHEFGDSCLFLP